MAQKFLTSINLNKNELQNARHQNLAAAPSSPVNGQVYYNTVDEVSYEWNGTAWVPFDAAKVPDGHIPVAKLATNPLARANHTGTQLASTISDFDTQVRTSRLDQMAAPTTDLGLNGHKIVNVADGVSNSDAATVGQMKAAIEAAVEGLDWKEAVAAVADANITLSGLQTIDDVVLIAGDRVLVAGQTDAEDNGIYIAGTGAWVRAADADTADDIANMAVRIADGTGHKGSVWKLTTVGTIVLNTTPLTFAEENLGGGGGTYTAGNGLNLAGTEFSVDAGTGITVDAGGVHVDKTVVATKYSADVGNGTDASIAVTHNLGTKDVIVSVREKSGDELVVCDVTATSTNVVTLGFAVAPANASLRVTVIG